jgi:hypothetical protein
MASSTDPFSTSNILIPPISLVEFHYEGVKPFFKW